MARKKIITNIIQKINYDPVCKNANGIFFDFSYRAYQAYSFFYLSPFNCVIFKFNN